MILNEPAWNALQKAQKNASLQKTINDDENQESTAMGQANRAIRMVQGGFGSLIVVWGVAALILGELARRSGFILWFLFSILGTQLGARFGKTIARRLKPGLLGGIILIVIGIKILLSHLLG